MSRIYRVLRADFKNILREAGADNAFNARVFQRSVHLSQHRREPVCNGEVVRLNSSFPSRQFRRPQQLKFSTGENGSCVTDDRDSDFEG